MTIIKFLFIAAILGALLDIGVFAYQLELRSNQTTINAKTDCWSKVLDNAVNGHYTQHELINQAKVCTKIQ